MRVDNIIRTVSAAALCACTAFAGINTGGHKGTVRTLAAPTMGASVLNIGSGISIFQSKGFLSEVYNSNDSAIYTNNPSRDYSRLLSTNIFLCGGLTQFWDVGIAWPFLNADWMGFDDKSDYGIGDIEISSKFLYPPLSKRLFYQAYYAAVTIPVGMKSSGLFPRNPYYIEGNDTNPASNFYSSEYVTVNMQALLTFDFSVISPRLPLQAHVNLGGVISSSLAHQRNTAIVSIAVEYTPMDIFTMGLDFHGESRWRVLSRSPDPSNDPLLLSPFFRLNTVSGLYLCLTADISLSSRAQGTQLHWHPEEGPASGYRYNTAIQPNFGIQFTIGWKGYVKEPDIDRDSIPNSRDRCLKEKEDHDGFNDDDGCPDPDNDGDGIPDSVDKCQVGAEDRDGFNDDDGCPDPDNDGDGIKDSLDRCPGYPEDFDGFQDADGCPDRNNDRDAVVDSVDKCTNEAEDIDGYKDDDGCPDPDNDQDGIPDSVDRCPEVAGSAAGRGCQDDSARTVKKEAEFPKSLVLTNVNFRKGTGELTFESYQFLEPVVQKLRDNPSVEIELHGHTESMGNYLKNMQLSQLRAEAVRQFLISKGIAASRIRAVGFGSSSPVADNKTAAGRAANRRIEMVRVK